MRMLAKLNSSFFSLLGVLPVCNRGHLWSVFVVSARDVVQRRLHNMFDLWLFSKWVLINDKQIRVLGFKVFRNPACWELVLIVVLDSWVVWHALFANVYCIKDWRVVLWVRWLEHNRNCSYGKVVFNYSLLFALFVQFFEDAWITKVILLISLICNFHIWRVYCELLMFNRRDLVV